MVVSKSKHGLKNTNHCYISNKHKPLNWDCPANVLGVQKWPEFWNPASNQPIPVDSRTGFGWIMLYTPFCPKGQQETARNHPPSPQHLQELWHEPCRWTGARILRRKHPKVGRRCDLEFSWTKISRHKEVVLENKQTFQHRTANQDSKFSRNNI